MRDIGLYRGLMRYTETLRASVEFDTAVVYLVADVGGETILLPELVSGMEFQVFAGLALSLGEGISGRAATGNAAIVNEDPAREIPGGLDTQMSSALAMPLVFEGRLVGVLTLYHLAPNAFNKQDLSIVYPLAWEMACMVSNQRVAQEADVHALVDYSTGLSNARAFLQQVDAEIARAQRASFPIAVLSCRLRGGNESDVNQLRQAAARLRGVVRAYDTVARVAGTEFMILMPELDGDNVERRVRILRLELGEFPFAIGTALFGVDGGDAETLAAVAGERSKVMELQTV